MNGFRLALSFLTIIPVGRYQYRDEHWGAAALCFPIVGALIGALIALFSWASGHLFDDGVTAVLSVTLWAILTGGLHLDGLADCCDGLLVIASRERRLQILRDSSVGAFGATGLILFLMAKVVAVHTLLTLQPDLITLGFILIFTTAIARITILWVARQPSARPDGMGHTFSAQLTPRILLVTTLIPMPFLYVVGWRGGAAVIATCLVTAGVILLGRRRIGGVTGDLFGLCVELTELLCLLMFIAEYRI